MSPTLAARRARRALWVFITVGSALLVIGLVIGTLKFVALTQAVRDTQLEGTPTGQKLLESSDRILDCTDPHGQCFQASQKRTAQAVGNINRVIVLAAACSAGLNPHWSVAHRQTAIQACVIERLSSKP